MGYTGDGSKHIEPGDYVGTQFRGGTREGYVKDVHGEKVVFETQRGKLVEHNKSTLAVNPDLSKRATTMGDDEKAFHRAQWEQEMPSSSRTEGMQPVPPK
ncbi:hypothetical protein DUNSADRAFT_4189 [Dunaliella salina]|uniref:Hypervirulence associated protein TUDOR domain-containing protein n=1 Tax=Dunaliella salina TaxID=3046 RepID=A0ABQ7GSM1_DUNSA|nr:hypothetical protein DUNSADRAFT_4189 [Dunaliella salina]|eukprot:KAF5837553.1 hypothetical protein DUNSADRAFT_4189 [Dunaliella salina]